MSAPAESTFAWEPLTPAAAWRRSRAPGSAVCARAIRRRVTRRRRPASGFFPMAVSRPCVPPFEICRRRRNSRGPAGLARPSAATPRRRPVLAFMVDPNHSGQIHSPADVQIEFGRESVRIISLLGYTEQDYPRDWIVSFNRTDLGTALGCLGAGTAGHCGFGRGGRPDAGVGGAGGGLSLAGPAHQLFCKPRFGFPSARSCGGWPGQSSRPARISPATGKFRMAARTVGKQPLERNQTPAAAASDATTNCTSSRRLSRARANAATPRGVSGSHAKVDSAGALI